MQLLPRTEVSGRIQLIPHADVLAACDLRHGAVTTPLEQHADMLIRLDNARRGLPESTDVHRIDVTDGKTRRITTAPDAVAFRGVARYVRRAPLTYRKDTHTLTERTTRYVTDIDRTRAVIERDARPIERVIFVHPYAPFRSVSAYPSHARNYTQTIVTRESGEISPQVFSVTQLVTRVVGTRRGFIGHRAHVFAARVDHPARTAVSAERIEQGLTTSNGGRPIGNAWELSPRSLAARVARLDEGTRDNVRTFLEAFVRADETELTVCAGETVRVIGGRVTRENGTEYGAAEYVRRLALTGALTFTD